MKKMSMKCKNSVPTNACIRVPFADYHLHKMPVLELLFEDFSKNDHFCDKFLLSRVIRWVCQKIAQNMAQLIQIFNRRKKYPKIRATSEMFNKTV
jgi:hypothetical protein